MLHTSQLTFAYKGQSVLQFPDLQCNQGEHWLLLGQSGSGKTTLLHLLGGLLSPRFGQVVVADQTITGLKAAALDRFRGSHIGIIFQKSHFVRALSVEQNLALAQKLAGKSIDKKRIGDLLDHLNLGHKKHSRPDQLSVGEQQRAAIARALLNQPAVILADEPTSALDDHNCGEVIKLLETEAGNVGATLLVVTHDGRLKTRFSNQVTL